MVASRITHNHRKRRLDMKEKVRQMDRKTAVKKEKAGKIGQEPKVDDKVADDIRGSLKAEKVDVKLRASVSKGLQALAESIKGQTRADSPLMKSLKAIESGVVRVESVRRPMTKIAKRAIGDISELPDIQQSIEAARQALGKVKREISASVKSHLDDIERQINKRQGPDFSDIEDRIRTFLRNAKSGKAGK